MFLPLAVGGGDLATYWVAWEKCVRRKSSNKTYTSLEWFLTRSWYCRYLRLGMIIKKIEIKKKS